MATTTFTNGPEQNVYSFSEVKRELRAVGVTIKWDAEWEEYRVNLRNGTAATIYFTDDLIDALYTGLDMAANN